MEGFFNILNDKFVDEFFGERIAATERRSGPVAPVEDPAAS